MKPELIIWDWNGTLLNDVEVCYQIANRMLKERGMRLLRNVEHYLSIFCFPVTEYYRAMGYTYEKESHIQISDEFTALYAEFFPGCRLQPYAKETLQSVRSLGIRQSLLSATGSDRLSAQVASFGLLEYFDEVIGQSDNLAFGKIETGRAYLSRCGIDSSRVLFVGDTAHDYEVAAAIGCGCILTDIGHQPESRLTPFGVPVLRSLHDLPSFLHE